MIEEQMDCREALRLLAEYLDHELDGVEKARVQRHLETCRDCYSRAEFERRLKDQLGGLGRAPVDTAFEQRMRELIRTFDAEPGSSA